LLELGLYPNQSFTKISAVLITKKHASDYGLTVSSFDKDFLPWYNEVELVASDMSKGVQFLMKKKNKLMLSMVLENQNQARKSTLQTKTKKLLNTVLIIISLPLSTPRELPNLPQDDVKVLI
jgi:dihydrolipoamide dehydrogenase